VDEKARVRLDFDRMFRHSDKPCPAWVIVDPNFHWAIMSWELDDGLEVFRGTAQYREEIADIAFPREITVENLDLVGHVLTRSVRDFEMPVPCRAMAKDFTLESCGLKPPGSGFKK
jgi:hypothetical protein